MYSGLEYSMCPVKDLGNFSAQFFYVVMTIRDNGQVHVHSGAMYLRSCIFFQALRHKLTDVVVILTQ